MDPLRIKGDEINFKVASSFIAGILILMAGCSGDAPLPSYEVRGVIQQIRPIAGGLTAVTIVHEEIPEFRNQAGDVVGMEAMQMTFYADASVSLENFAANDPIRFTFAVQWKKNPRLLLTQIEKIIA